MTNSRMENDASFRQRVSKRDRRALALPSLRVVFALMLREMATGYGRAAGGYIWAFAEPIGGLVLLTLAFSMSFHAPPLGDSFALFYATGLLPFMVYMDVSSKLSQSINFSIPLLAYPRVTIVDTLIARAALSALTQCFVFLSVLIALMWIFGMNGRIAFSDILLAMGAALLLGGSVGTLNCYMVTKYPIWQRIWSIANRPLFLVSCVVFTFESVPASLQKILWFNPIVHIVGWLRSGVYFNYQADFASMAYVGGVALSCASIGLFLQWLHHDQLLNP